MNNGAISEGIQIAYGMAAAVAQDAARSIEGEMVRPSVLMRPRIFIDGNQWCALYGDNLQDGVAGFGDSPAQAMYRFDEEWGKSLPATDTKGPTTP